MAAPTLLFLLVSSSCRTATQIIVDVSSDQCALIGTTDVTVAGDETTLATKTISDASRVGCVSSPQVGKVVLVPDRADDMEVVIRIVSGLGKPASSCREGDDGCIVARRRARFVPNEVVNVSVVMSLTCQRIVCAAGESCDPVTGRCRGLAESGGEGTPPQPDAGEPDANANVEEDGGACSSTGCVFDCNVAKECKTPPCQPGKPCVINCNAADACSDIDCGAASSCEVNCNVENACKGKNAIKCGTGAACTVTCKTKKACGTDVQCTCQGPCDVKCTSNNCESRNVACCADDCTVPSVFKCQGQCD
ncbi:MAG: hypothetical protein KF764_26440 [Labilithrix sp.]|nr:hypothetical protein [Labilithrix sp.]MBX3221634.1 hypothetical protein [Labilithrix sp.]